MMNTYLLSTYLFIHSVWTYCATYEPRHVCVHVCWHVWFGVHGFVNIDWGRSDWHGHRETHSTWNTQPYEAHITMKHTKHYETHIKREAHSTMKHTTQWNTQGRRPICMACQSPWHILLLLTNTSVVPRICLHWWSLFGSARCSGTQHPCVIQRYHGLYGHIRKECVGISDKCSLSCVHNCLYVKPPQWTSW
mgnify:CR=1 FL=1